MVPAQRLRGQEVLIASLYFREYSGSEMNSLELADLFAEWGANVTIAASSIGEPALGVAVSRGHRTTTIEDLATSGRQQFELGWIQQGLTYHALQRLGLNINKLV